MGIKKFSTKHIDLICLLFLSLLILVFFFRYLDGSNLFFAADEASSDLLDFNYPQRVYLANHLKQGKIPLWTPYQSNGFPFLAEAQSGVFYPVNLALFYFFDPSFAFNWSIIVSFIILSFGTYFLAKTIGCNTASSLYAGAIMPFTGFFVAQLRHVQLLQSAAFFPLMLLFTEKILRTKKRIYVVWLSSTMAFAILAGHIPTAYSLILIATIYFFIRSYQLSKTSSESLAPIILYFISILCALGITAVQLLPTFEMIPYSTRKDITGTVPSTLPIRHLTTFLNPYYFGDPSRESNEGTNLNFWENTGYIGIIPLFLALYAIIKRVKGMSVFVLCLLGSIFFVLGIPRSLFEFVWNFIPGLSFIRLPSRFLIFVDFFLIFTSAYSFQRITTKANRPIIPILLISLSIFDLWSNFFFFNGQIPAKKWLTMPQSARFLSQDKDYFRITVLNQGESYDRIRRESGSWTTSSPLYLASKEQLPATLNSLFAVKSVHFPNEYFGSFSLKRRSDLSLLTQHQSLSDPAIQKILGVQNVKYILTMEPPKEATPEAAQVFETPTSGKLPPIKIYQNPSFLPRAYLVSHATTMKESDIIPYMLSSTFDPRNEVILEKQTRLPYPHTSPVKDSIKLVQDIEDKSIFFVSASQSSYLVVSDTYYPGWKALVDGKATEVLRANYAFRSITLPAGKHHVAFIYDPLSFKIGAIISLITILILLVFSLKVLMPENYRGLVQERA